MQGTHASKQRKCELAPEVLESRLNLSSFGGLLMAPSATGILNPFRIMGAPSTKTTTPVLKVANVGATALGNSLTNVAVDSYTAISNCAVEYQGGQPDIGYVSAKGAYVEYTVTAASAGQYTLSVGVASYTGVNMQVMVNGVAAGTVAVGANYSWTSYVPGSATITLAAGVNVIRLASQNGTQYNINSMGLTPVAASNPPQVPTTSVGDNTAIDLTTYSAIWQSALEYQGGKADIGYVAANGAYVEYTIDVATAGTYTLSVGMADVAASTMAVTDNGGALATISTTSTGGWGSFSTFSQNVTLGAGVQTLRFMTTNWSQYNLGSIQLVRQVTQTQAPASVTQRWMTSFNEIDVVGTSGNDSIYVSQSGNVLTIVSNGQSQQVAANGELVIWGGDGNDTITVDSSVTLDTRMYGGNGNNTLADYTRGQATIVLIGGGLDVLTGNGINTSYWADGADVVNASAAEKAMGGVHTVTGFYGGVGLALNGPNLTDPTSGGSGWTRLTNNSLFGLGAVQTDINQGQASDCYFLASMQSLARLQPGALRQLGVDLGDGTYAIEFKRNGVTQFVRVDGDLPTASWGGLYYAHPGATGDQWVAIFEKAYAEFRTGANSYASLNYGLMTNVYNDFGIGATTISLPTDGNSFYTMASAKLSAGKAVDIGTNTTILNGAPMVANHAYSVTNVWKDGSGTVWVTLRNPWGIDGFGWDSNPNDGLLTMTYAMMEANASYGTMMT